MAAKPSRTVAAVVMAAGKGKRLKSALPKVLHSVCGRPVLWHVLHAVERARPDRVVVVVSHGREAVEKAVRSWNLKSPIRFVDQGEPLGTGHAVMAAERAVGRATDVLVVPGDNPLLTWGMLRDLLRLHRRRTPAATVQTTVLPDATGYGRIIRNGERLVRIAEERDSSPEERAIREVATSVYAFRRDDLFRALSAVGRDNSQGEYYLPDVLGILVQNGDDVRALAADYGGALDVNSRAALARAAGAMRRRINEDLMAVGVTLVDPDRTYVDAGVQVGIDTVIQPLTFLEGETRIGKGCTIGPATRIADSRVDDQAEVQFSVVRGAKIGARATVGPYANIRPGTVLAPDAKAGTFVEIKASRVGEGSKVPHLSYVGDAEIGKGANIGAGTITCNYDGYEKHRTVIGDRAFIGSDTMLVAPVRLGREAVTGAGSAITRDVPDGALAVERAEQRVVEGYSKRRKPKGKSKAGKKRGR
ncbi:MAG TPA: bifunctional UDP-N-acetylglucosamine diphosphorylase/glucosamine-1-phosphate N-acetyltransferase GlmU [Actinomycetota bacterium]|nr:bifunctional UDP-N-acetylglucosamine diphosphorylase/glucosamine-1-phosphate N-acetyltransferase GlmU [Actinomycetota bacterium]